MLSKCFTSGAPGAADEMPEAAAGVAARPARCRPIPARAVVHGGEEVGDLGMAGQAIRAAAEYEAPVAADMVFQLPLDVGEQVELAPKRNRSGCQRWPSSRRSARGTWPALADEMPPGGPVRRPMWPVSSEVVADRAHHHQRDIQRGVDAFLPVLVLMKSAPAIIATHEARATLSNVCSSPVARMALSGAHRRRRRGRP